MKIVAGVGVRRTEPETNPATAARSLPRRVFQTTTARRIPRAVRR
jgi:hypothetical protein